jgi:hypothetical protein
MFCSGGDFRQPLLNWHVCSLTNVLTVASGHVGIDVYISTAYGPFSAADVSTLTTFVNNGGGLVISGQSWWWASQNPNVGLDQYPGEPMMNEARGLQATAIVNLLQQTR